MRLVCAFFAGIILLAAPNRSFACKCAPPPGPSDALRDAAAVFEAKVTKLTPLHDADDDLEVHLNVVQAWKGVETETIRILTRKDGAACGIDFTVGESYLVYASQAEAQASGISLVALRCGRTKLTAEAALEDLPQLGMGVVPVAARDPSAVTAPATSGHAADSASQPAAQQSAPEPPAAGGCASCSTGGDQPSAPLFAGSLLATLALTRVLRRQRPR
jgi:MYXO-CTERM domain-containing protein